MYTTNLFVLKFKDIWNKIYFRCEKVKKNISFIEKNVFCTRRQFKYYNIII